MCEGEEPKIEGFIRDIKVKKDFIDVRETLVKYEEPTGEFKVFKIKYGDVPEELGDRLGAALLYLGATNQKIDAGFKMLGEKQDQMLGKQDMMLEKQDMMLEKQDDTIAEIRNVTEKIEYGKEDIVTEIKSLRPEVVYG